MRSLIQYCKSPIIPFTVAILIISMLISSFTIWGLDGSLLWMPIVSEFSKGNFHYSDVIFGGQNLHAIYGAVPSWYLFKILGAGPVQLLNLTYVLIFICFYIPTLAIFYGISQSRGWRSQLLILVYVFLSPIILNRVYSGHLNLLFGMLPLLISIAMIYQRSKYFDIFAIFALYHSFSIQGYQILSYHLFYVPILIVWLHDAGTGKKYFFARLAVVTFFALILSSRALSEMVSHSVSGDNLRSGFSAVYSYLVSEFSDIPNLIFSSYLPSLCRNNPFLFHEINYPIGAGVMAYPFLDQKLKRIFITIISSIFLLFLFSSAVTPFDLIAKTPIIELFRVPQRSLMLPAYLLPLFLLSTLTPYLNITFFLVFVSSLLLGNLNDFLGLVITAASFIFLLPSFSKSSRTIAFGLAFSTFFFGLSHKIGYVVSSNGEFNRSMEFVKTISREFKIDKKNDVIYFAQPFNAHHISSANFLGIRTFQGYGHPPKKLFDRSKEYFNINPDPTINVFDLAPFENRTDFLHSLSRFGFSGILFLENKQTVGFRKFKEIK